MIEVFLCLLLKILVHIHFCSAEKDVSNVGEHKVTELFPEIYDTYLQAVSKDENVITRRLFKNSNKYTLHIQKLKEVNGVKTHNIVVTKFLRSDEPLVYINNPVESRTPNAFLTQEQFKRHLMNNIRQQQQEFENQKIQKVLSRFKMKPKKKVKHEKKHVPKYSASNFNDVSTKRTVDEEPILTRIPTTRTTTDNSRDLFIAMLNGETLPSKIIFTTIRNNRQLTVRSVTKDPVVPIDITTKHHVLINTTIDTVINDTISSEENSSETTTGTTTDVTSSETTASTTTDVSSSENITTTTTDLTTSETTASTTTDVTASETTASTTTDLTTSETTTSTTTDATSSETTADIRSDLVETSSETTASTTTDVTPSETTTTTSEATTPIISTELTSTESTTTRSTRSTRGRPFVFMGLD